MEKQVQYITFVLEPIIQLMLFYRVSDITISKSKKNILKLLTISKGTYDSFLTTFTNTKPQYKNIYKNKCLEFKIIYYDKFEQEKL